MKGKLKKRNEQWYVTRIEEGDWETYYLIDPEQKNQLSDDDEGDEVNFYKDETNPNNYVRLKFSFPELERKLRLTIESWDTIFDYIKDNLNEDLPLRVRNYLKNTYSIPIKINNKND